MHELSGVFSTPCDPFFLAKEFVTFVNAHWSDVEDQSPGDLFSYFVDWVEDTDFISLVGGNRTKALETFLVIVGWYGTSPEDFAPIRDGVKVPLAIGRDDHRLPTLLDEDVWNHHVFVRKYGGAKH